MSLLEYRCEDRIGTLVMNHPKRRNALGTELIEEFIAALVALEKQKVKVIVLRSAGDTGTWSAGHDLRELTDRDPLAPDELLPRLLRAVERFPAPVLAMIDGGVFGGAVELAIACDLRLGSPEATFTMPPARIGLPYTAEGLKRFIQTLGLPITRELFFTATPMTADRAQRLGLLNHLVPVAELESFTYRMARQIERNSPVCISALKESLRLLTEASPLPDRILEDIEALRNRVFESDDHREGVQAILEKRAANFAS